jgi:pimeloyl-ACP methyl ester carboxylesterase
MNKSAVRATAAAAQMVYMGVSVTNEWEFVVGLMNGRARTGSAHWRAAAGGAAALALVAGLPVAAGASAARAVPPPVVRAVRWGRCGHGIPKPFQCATAPVPLNYADPGGAKIKISLLRLPAADPGKRIGSLFVDFGGPGGPDVTDLVNRAYTVFSAAIRRRFDLVTWDPRGVEYSDPVNCFASAAASNAYFNSIPVFPYPQSTEPGYFAANAKLGRDCQRRAGSLLAHVSSADTARDLNLLRADVGDRKLTYWGFSYGTVIGAIYANLFPTKVRAMMLDGTLDFVGNATGHRPGEGAKYPVDVRQGVDRAGQEVFLHRFLPLCKRAGKACAFSGGNLPAKWTALLARARAGKLSYQTLMTFAYYDMEDPIADWPGLATELQSLYTSTSHGRVLPTAAAARLAAAAQRAASGAQAPTAAPGQGSAPAARYTSNRSEAYYAIQCADSLVPTRTGVYHNLAKSEDRKVPGFGRLIVYDMMPCASWPDLHTDAYDGPWNRSKTTILVVNATHDPITPIWGAKAAVAELGNARLLRVAGDGHTSMYVEPSTCRDKAQAAYLIARKLPAAGTVCPVNQLPFGLPPPAPAAH